MRPDELGMHRAFIPAPQFRPASAPNPEVMLRADLMELLPPEHPVHDPNRSFTMYELLRFVGEAA